MLAQTHANLHMLWGPIRLPDCSHLLAVCDQWWPLFLKEFPCDAFWRWNGNQQLHPPHGAVSWPDFYIKETQFLTPD